MGVPFSLLDQPWLPARRADGARQWIRPAEITTEIDRNPVVAIDWSRPDFDAATREFLIGLLAVSAHRRAQQTQFWAEWFRSPPPTEALDAALAPLRHAFVLDGAGPRFLQDMQPLEGEAVPVSQLLIDAPGEATIRKNLDHFVRRGGVETLSRAGAAMALFTLQTYAPSGGAGHRVGLRGGGPLTTLVFPERPEEDLRPVSLWHVLWLNVPVRAGDIAPTSFDARVFPWLGPTRTSEKDQGTTRQDVDALQVFWGMPRRIRLDFEPNTENRRCDLTGAIDTMIVRTYRTRPRGTKYEAFQHPLSPHYQAKGSEGWLPVHGQPGRTGWRDWLGLVFADAETGRRPADVLGLARNRLKNIRPAGWRHNHVRLIAAGYDMDNMKARNFIESEMPVHLLDADVAQEYEPAVRELVKGGRAAEQMLSQSIRMALFNGDPKNAPGSDAGPRGQARERFWDETEHTFHRLLDRLVEDLATTDEEAIRQAKQVRRNEWHGKLRETCLRIFDDSVTLDQIGAIDLKEMRQRIEARRSLTVSLAGYGKSGSAFFAALGKPPPEISEKPKKSSKSPRRSKKEPGDDRPAA
jgi:CRISPR system Cascade subunit CasA